MKVVIVGSGISALATAFFLLKNNSNIEIQMLEATSRIGGVIGTTLEANCIIEEGPDSFLTTKPWAIDLCHELGLSDEIIGTNQTDRRAFVAYDGKLEPVPEGFVLLAPTKIWSLIDSPMLSIKGKIDAALEVFRPAYDSTEDETLKSFIVRRFGEEMFERIAQPMVGGIYTGDPAKLSASATLPQFVEMEHKYGSVTRGMLSNGHHNGKDSGARYSAFATLRTGMQTLVDKLVERIGASKIRLNASVRTISRVADRWKITTCSGDLIDADAIVLAAPAHKVSNIVSSFDSVLSSCLEKIEHASSAVINLLFDQEDLSHKLDGFGFVVPERERKSIIACSFSSNKFMGRAPRDKVLLRVFLGGTLHPEIYGLSDGDMIKVAVDDLRTYLSINRYPRKIWLRRWPMSMPQYNVGHLELVKDIKRKFAAHPGLIWAGSSLSGVGIPDCVRSGLEAAELIDVMSRQAI